MDMQRLIDIVSENYAVDQNSDSESVAYSKTKTAGDASVTISATAPSMQELHDVLQLAGITLPADHPSMQEPKAEDPQDCAAEPEADGPTTLNYRYETDKEKLIDIIKQRLQQKLG